MNIALLTCDDRDLFKDYANPEPYFGTAPQALLQGLAEIEGLRVDVVTCARKPMDSPTKLAENIWFHSLLVPKFGWMRTGYQGCIRSVRKYLQSIGPQLVHGQGTERDCAISALFSGFPNLVTVHGNMRLIARVNRARPFTFMWLAARLESFTLRRTDGVVCIARYTQQAVSDLARRTWLIPNGVDASFFKIDAQPLPAQPPSVLCVGAICPRKNQNAFLQAIDSLSQEQPFKLTFLGKLQEGRSYDEQFLGLVRQRPWCQYAGVATREQLKSYLRGASLLALPSLEDNCPMVVLEAMAAGVPVVAAKVGGVPELIEENITGLLCDPLDPTSMRSAVEQVLAHPIDAQEMAKRAKKRALQRFHPVAIARQHMEIYQELLGKS